MSIPASIVVADRGDRALGERQPKSGPVEIGPHLVDADRSDEAGVGQRHPEVLAVLPA